MLSDGTRCRARNLVVFQTASENCGSSAIDKEETVDGVYEGVRSGQE